MGGQASRQTERYLETSDLEYPAFTILRLPIRWRYQVYTNLRSNKTARHCISDCHGLCLLDIFKQKH